jgi:hypothetical protein
MTSVVPSDPKQAPLLVALAELKEGITDFREALRPVNDVALNDSFREVLDAAERIIEQHSRRARVTVADDAASLRSLFARAKIPRGDPDLGKIPTLTALRGARGNILADFDQVLVAAKALRRVPIDSKLGLLNTIALDRAGREGQLATLEKRLREVERELETNIALEGSPDHGYSPQQVGLVNFYLESMQIQLALAKLEARAKQLVDLAGLARAIEAIAELTVDFIATTRGLRKKITGTLAYSAEAIRPAVNRVVGGFRTIVQWTRRQARRRGLGLGMALPVVSTNTLAGMIEEIAAEPYLGRADLPALADSLQIEVDELFPIAETLQLLRFAEIEEGDIKLTPAGQRFAEADVDVRKKLFGDHLLSYLPLAARIKLVLDERPTHTARAVRFLEELEDYMSEDYADRTLKSMVNWGRYGELFAYDETSETFSLENPK